MTKIKVTCDSTCDLTKELCDKYGIEVIPLGISLGNDFYKDGVDVHVSDMFGFVEKTGELPKTSAVSPAAYEEVFSRYVNEGCAVIHINLCSDMSSCYQNACIAASELQNVYPVDSRNLSSGSAYLALAAAEMAASGMEAPEIVKQLNEMKGKLDVSFVLHTLDYLKKGGRCSALAAFSAGVLQIRPEIEVREDGIMHVGKKFRGNLEASIRAYVKNRLEGRTDIDLKRVFVTSTFVPDDIMARTVELVKELQPFSEVLINTAGVTISSHCGPQCMGVLFFKK